MSAAEENLKTPATELVPVADDSESTSARALLMLTVATVGFALNFWAWALLSPLGPSFKESLGLSSFAQAALVAVPVVVGSLGRIPVGALTDRFGGRVMFPLVSACTIMPVLFVGLVGHQSLFALLVGGFFLGIGGTAFAVGVPFVNSWFPPRRRGLAIGLFGAGMGGTAISALTTVPLVDAGSVSTPFLVTAAALLIYAIVAALILRDAPARVVPTEPLARRLSSTARMTVTRQASVLYAVAFGGYVAFSVYLPAYLKTAYGLEQADAAARMAGFVLLAVAMRPVGGWLADHLGPIRVLVTAMAVVSVAAAVQAFTPALMPVATVAFLSMAAALGAASGAVFALVALLAPGERVGSVTGMVGAAGGLGGFVPPLVMGAVYGALGSYGVGLAALAVVAAATGVFTLTAVRKQIPVPA
ncbi:Probable nitrate/nitrite transporter narK2 [Nocardia otitidiscaviarum]|uniref:Probable nitrate/nitrite transporter narK2 n=2 Tax=Nocardia otitidiscaviarum TaxID=1823 RepID=A0A378YKN3_9NOCA|nr:MFS transporter [Nocardia otitidiscaviarum]SUA77732.1 Probable nitrate/nitrite transporter narK2 [Nocardia otitidiscaviarum]